MTAVHDGPHRTTPERCDRCGARAAFLARLRGGGELAFCGHHHRMHRERLRSSGSVVWALPSRSAGHAA